MACVMRSSWSMRWRSQQLVIDYLRKPAIAVFSELAVLRMDWVGTLTLAALLPKLS